MTTEIERIADLMEETFDGKPYYGPSLVGALEDVTADLAARRPDSTAHNIWEIVLHLTAELYYACDVINGTAEPWIEGETTWRAVMDTSEDSWRQAIHSLKQANRALVRTVRALDDAVVTQEAQPSRRPFYVMLHGTLDHGIYHAGQIMLLKKLCAAPRLDG